MTDFLRHIWVSTWKEYKLLKRDKGGLLVLFLMPAALVIIITLVQENVMELSGESATEMLYYDLDRGMVGEKIRSSLTQSERIKLIELDTETLSKEEAVKKVHEGDYQVCVVVPEDISQKLRKRSQQVFSGTGSNINTRSELLPIYFDPGVLPGYRTGIVALVKMALFQVEIEIKIGALQNQAESQFSFVSADGNEKPDLKKSLLREKIVEVTVVQSKSDQHITPSAVQNNIPAWALFGLFFTCIPLAGSLLNERNSGIWIRIIGLPSSTGALLTGKICAYIAVCFCQITLIVIIGIYLFPSIGLPSFIISGDFFSLIVVSLCCALAACGYGIFLGSVCTSLAQASMFGSISIVIAASLGGTLVPIYAMPQVMQKISVVSPLNWGLSSYQDILLRNNSLVDVSYHLLLLVLFFLTMLGISWYLSNKRG